MEAGSKFDDIIIRYLLNEATREEEAWVKNWTMANEKNRLYVEGLRNTLQLIDVKKGIDKINVEEEWHFLRKELNSSRKVVYRYDSGPQESAWETTPEQAGKTKIFKIVLSTAVAASVLLVIGLGIWGRQSEGDDKSGPVAAAPAKRENSAHLMAYVQHEVNTSGKTRSICLPDGSEITLHHNSELTYKEPAGGRSRQIYLTGKACFNVAKDTARPLTVFSGDIATTALGTRFVVTAAEGEPYIRVRLNEGKVVVKPEDKQAKQSMKEAYLLPGQEIIYDNIRKTARVRWVNQTEIAARKNRKEIIPAERPSIPEYRKTSWFMFNNQSLSEIFEALEDMYDARIIYSKKEVESMYFIGTFDKGEKLENILKQIASLNNLTVTKTDKTFRIEKKVPKAKGGTLQTGN